MGRDEEGRNSIRRSHFKGKSISVSRVVGLWV